jgi:hypothetical protein
MLHVCTISLINVCSLQLAQRLQLEEDEHARRVYEERLRRADEKRLQQQGQGQTINHPDSRSQDRGSGIRESIKQKKKKEKGDCIIM